MNEEKTQELVNSIRKKIRITNGILIGLLALAAIASLIFMIEIVKHGGVTEENTNLIIPWYILFCICLGFACALIIRFAYYKVQTYDVEGDKITVYKKVGRGGIYLNGEFVCKGPQMAATQELTLTNGKIACIARKEFSVDIFVKDADNQVYQTGNKLDESDEIIFNEVTEQKDIPLSDELIDKAKSLKRGLIFRKIFMVVLSLVLPLWGIPFLRYAFSDADVSLTLFGIGTVALALTCTFDIYLFTTSVVFTFLNSTKSMNVDGHLITIQGRMYGYRVLVDGEVKGKVSIKRIITPIEIDENTSIKVTYGIGRHVITFSDNRLPITLDRNNEVK